MQYQSPLNIIHDKNWEDLSPTNLTRWRKELLLRFDLEGTTTINVNRRAYDKNTILENFETLQKEGDFHIELAKNKELLTFLQDGDTKLFRDPNFSQLFHKQLFREKISQPFQNKLSEILYQNVQSPNFHKFKQLKDIKGAEAKIPKYILEAASAKTHSFLRKKLAEAKTKFKNPINEKNSKLLKPGIEEYVNTSFLNALRYLPSAFSGIQFQYALFAHSIIYAMFRKPRQVDKLPRKTLVILEAVAEFELDFRHDADVVSILKDIKAALSGTTYSNNEGCSGLTNVPIFIICFLVFLFRVGMVADGCNKRKSPTDYRVNQYDGYKNKHRLPFTPQIKNRQLIGTWEHEKTLKSKIILTETFTFYDEQTGSIKLEIENAERNVFCNYSIPFSWELLSKSEIKFTFWDYENRDCINRRFKPQDLNLLKKYDHAIKDGTMKTTFIFHGKKGNAPQRINIGVVYYDQNKFSNATIIDDFDGIEKILKETKKKLGTAEETIDFLANKVQFGENGRLRIHQFEYDLKTENYNCLYLSSTLPLFKGVKRNDKHYLKPLNWAKYDASRYFAYIRNVDFIDKRGKEKTGDLMIFFDPDYSKLLVSEEIVN